MHRNKKVEIVAAILAVVDLDLEQESTLVRWMNVAGADGDFRNQAKAKVVDLRPESGPTRVFLLGPLFATEFRKDSPGGMQASKRYFDISGTKARDAAELANALRGQVWSKWS